MAGRCVSCGTIAAVGLLAVALAIVGGCASPQPKADLAWYPAPPAAAHVVHLLSFNSLHDIVPARVRWVDMFRGAPVSPHVDTPAGVAFGQGRLYICDTQVNAVHAWELATGEARSVGGGGDAPLGEPVDVAVDEQGVIYVADTGRGEVVAFGLDGSVVGKYSPAGGDADYRPVGLAVGGERLYVADAGSHRVLVFSTIDGRLVGTFGSAGAEPGQFFLPMDVIVDGGGQVFVADMMNSRVQVFDADGRFLRSMGRPGDRYGDLGKPKRVAVAPDGVIFIADPSFAHVHLFNSQGQLLMLLGGPEQKPGGTPMPAGVTIAETLPQRLTALVPETFEADYFLFVTNTIGPKRISLYAVGRQR